MAEFGKDLSPEDAKHSIELQREIKALSHAIQSGVAASMGMNASTETSPKHLRTGINIAMSEHAGLVTLLLKKNLITEIEYFEAVRNSLRQEVRDYESRLSKETGKNITLI